MKLTRDGMHVSLFKRDILITRESFFMGFAFGVLFSLAYDDEIRQAIVRRLS